MSGDTYPDGSHMHDWTKAGLCMHRYTDVKGREKQAFGDFFRCRACPQRGCRMSGFPEQRRDAQHHVNFS